MGVSFYAQSYTFYPENKQFFADKSFIPVTLFHTLQSERIKIPEN